MTGAAGWATSGFMHCIPVGYHDTHVPVEEPSTSSILDVRLIAFV